MVKSEGIAVKDKQHIRILCRTLSYLTIDHNIDSMEDLYIMYGIEQ